MVSNLESTQGVERWSDELLDSMRLRGDPPADLVIQALFRDREVKEARRLLRTLVENDQPPPDGLPPECIAYLNATSDPAASRTEAIEKGQDLFAEYGPLMLMCLGCYSLPASYAAAKGVKVLHRTAYLERRPTKRLFETTQMVIDVMTPGGLEPDGRGIRTVQKVRLMHAMVRHLIQNDQTEPWPAELGVPINQEDLAGTLMAFVWGTIDGLQKLGVDPSARHQEEYLGVWRVVGRLMGVEEVLLPRTMQEAEALKELIEKRQVAPSDEGRVLTRALLDVMRRNSELSPLQDLPAALMRHFLPERVSDFLGIPEHRFQELAVDALRLLTEGGELLLRESPELQRTARSFSIHFIRWMVDVQLGGRSAPFVVPLELRRRWRLTPEPTFSERLVQWVRRSWRRISEHGHEFPTRGVFLVHPLYTVDASNPAFNPFTWYNLIGAAGCVFWILAYLFILNRCFRDRTYGLPIIAICLNFAWEILASFVFPNPVPLWHFFDRAWLVIDVLLVYQLFRWGRAEQRIPELAKYFPFAIVVPFALGMWGLYAFVDSYVDRLGLVGAFGVNLIMSILFVFFYLARRGSGRGLSRGGAVFKMLGTLGTSIECHFVVRMINPELRSLSFLTFLCVSIFLFDCLYIYLVFRKPDAQAGATQSVAVAW